MAELVPEIIVLEPQEAIAVRGDVKIADLPAFFERAFSEAAEVAGASDVEIVGPPFGFYPEMPTETVVVEAGFPVSAPVEASGNVHRIVFPVAERSRLCTSVRTTRWRRPTTNFSRGWPRTRPPTSSRNVGVLPVRPRGRTRSGPLADEDRLAGSVMSI